MALPSKQKGMSVYTIALVILLVSFFATLLVKLGPVYVDQWYLNGMLESMAKDPETGNMNVKEVRDSLTKRMTVNNVSFDTKEGLKLDAKTTPHVLVLDYSKRVHVMFNVDALVTFYQEYPLLP